MSGVPLECILMLGYALSLALIAFLLEWIAHHAHRRSLAASTAGFTYHPDRNAWRCPKSTSSLSIADVESRETKIEIFFLDSCNSRANAVSSKSAQVTHLFTMSRNAFTCASVQPSQGITGILDVSPPGHDPILRAALRRRWPSITSPDDLANTGIAKPNCRMDAHIRSTAASFFLAFRGYSRRRAIGQYSMRSALGLGVMDDLLSLPPE
jgi:hypothetical protein